MRDFSVSLTTGEMLANYIDRVPFVSGYLNLPARILKLEAFTLASLAYLRESFSLKAPVDSLVLFCLFLVASYLPTLVCVFLYRLVVPAESKEVRHKYDPQSYQYNVVQSGGGVSGGPEVTNILKKVN